MDITAAKTTLNLRLRDTDNFAFTDAEKTQILNEAFEDTYVVNQVWDSSLSFSYTTYQYTVPATITVVQDIYIKPTNGTDSDPQKVDSQLWEVVNGTIQFKNNANHYIPSGYTLYLKGLYKYTTSDTITQVNLQEYVLNLAQLHCLNMFGLVKAIRFVNNDTSMSEIVTMKRELERKVAQYRARLPRAFVTA